ncbi:hypothetical protein IP92_04419 [Pseudoduganella flava]|uniref:CHAT domain-containing protein n=1 Tax=Pseudoduganella flava TaxID=871742 RepID=A0A562PJ68_9BURK|nr:hypothetical protein [Pseudoduganella flava]QGZ42043.1 hypothetical protein GO485_25355 [Pseudoduganella flava]TWI44469.1 hypothetical protein IP92_04419 [Pseudoduganella flava]
MARLRIAVIESPNPIDLFENRSEAEPLTVSCRLMGHQSTSFFARSRREFKETIDYIASADSVHAERFHSLPLILHISAHGNSECIGFGRDAVSWNGLVQDIQPLIDNPDYTGKLVLCLSSCDSGTNTLSRFIKSGWDGETKLPAYIFSIVGEEVNWDDALIAWNLLYLKLSKFGLKDRAKVMEALNHIYVGTGTAFSYSRWCDEEGKYLRYSARKEID